MTFHLYQLAKTGGQHHCGQGQMKNREEEVVQLKKKLRQTQMENEILKKAVAIFTRSPQ